MYLKKTIVLSSLDDSANKAVLNIEKFKSRIEGQIRLYNFKNEVAGILSLGFLKDGDVVKAGLQKIDKMKYSFVIEDENYMDILQEDKTVACALVNFQEGKAKPLLFGSSDGRLPKSIDLKLASGIQLFDQTLKTEDVTEFLDQENLEYEEELENEIQTAIDDNMNCCENKCVDCKYRQAFYSTNSEDVSEDKKLIFYDEIKSQIDELFAKFPEEDMLKNIIPNSKWVKVDYEDNGQYFVLGLIYGQDGLKYICYGVPGINGEVPDKENCEFAQWLPVVPGNDQGFGYWITYQDAQNGDNIQMEII